jgi:hypothetical protein
MNNRLLRQETDKGKKSNFMEHLLANALIRRNLGDDWWDAASVEIDAWVGNLRLNTPRKHPLSTFMTAWGERNLQPETWGRLISFAADLLDCIDEAGSEIESKLAELKSPSFFETWFEIHSASTFIRKGMHTRFIPSSDKEKRPDLEVNFQGTTFLVECKARKSLSVEERNSEAIFRKRMKSRMDSVESLLENASEKVLHPTTPYLVELKVERPNTDLSSLERKLLTSRIEVFLIRHPNVSAVELFQDMSRHEGDFVVFSTKIGRVFSQNSEYKLPIQFFETMADKRIDTRPEKEVLSTYALKH